MQISDAEIISRCLRGEREAFGALVERYQGIVYASAFAYLKNTEEARDIAQEVFVRAYSSLASLKKAGRFAAWLGKITTRLCIDKLRAQKKSVQLSQFPAFDDEDVLSRIDFAREVREEKAQLGQSIERVLGAIEQLPEYYRVAFVLKYMEGLSMKEIAHFLGVPISTVEGRLHKSRAYIRKELKRLRGKSS
jgi:RNA polymerase sigma-70 factor (ECF subfamily)